MLDVGGATGHYATWLAERGYAGHLVNPVPLHLEQAARWSATIGAPLASIRLSEALLLPMPTSSAAAVLLLGPLYHLTQRTDRLAALERSKGCTARAAQVAWF